MVNAPNQYERDSALKDIFQVLRFLDRLLLVYRYLDMLAVYEQKLMCELNIMLVFGQNFRFGFKECFGMTSCTVLTSE